VIKKNQQNKVTKYFTKESGYKKDSQMNYLPMFKYSFVMRCQHSVRFGAAQYCRKCIRQYGGAALALGKVNRRLHSCF